MSSENVQAMADNYRAVSRTFAAAGHVGPMVAHAEAATLLDMAASAVRDADFSCATLDWRGRDAPGAPDLLGVYQPRSRTIAIMSPVDLVTFTEDEAEALHAALGDALATRATGRGLMEERAA